MSTVLSSAAPSGTAKCGTAAQYEIPMKDATCGIPNDGDNRDVMEKCCKTAPVVAYNKDCAIYCPAVGQTVEDLTDCLYDEKIDWGDVWCHGSTTATATATDIPTATHTAKNSSTKTQSGTKTQSTNSSSATGNPTNAASPLAPKGLNSKAGLAICILLFPAIFTGALL